MIIHRLALRHHVRIHGFYAGHGKQAPCYFMDVEIPADWPLERGYHVVEAFRDSILHELKPEKVICRIEPDCRDMETGAIAEQVSPEEVRLKVNLILQQHRNIRKILKLDLTREDNFPTLTCVCSVDASLTIRECHQIASQLENQIENALHHLGRVTVIAGQKLNDCCRIPVKTCSESGKGKRCPFRAWEPPPGQSGANDYEWPATETPGISLSSSARMRWRSETICSSSAPPSRRKYSAMDRATSDSEEKTWEAPASFSISTSLMYLV